MARLTDLHNPLHGSEYCLDPEFYAYDHTTCPEIRQTSVLVLEPGAASGDIVGRDAAGGSPAPPAAPWDARRAALQAASLPVCIGYFYHSNIPLFS